MKPFVIVGMPRTGSTLLLRILQQHPAVLAFGELFHSLQAERVAPYHAVRRNGATVIFDEENGNPISFLGDWVWCGHNENFRAVGFKLFAEDSVAAITKEFFREMRLRFPDLHVLHIQRDNYLDVMVSRLLAEKTGEWFLEGSATGHESDHTLTLSIDEVSAYLEKMEAADAFLRSAYSDGQYMSVSYDKLSQNLQSTADDVFDFLGVEPCPVVATIRKQVKRSPATIIANYSELVEYFAKTRFAHCFGVEHETNSQQEKETVPDALQQLQGTRAWHLLSGKQLQFSEEYHEKPRREILPVLPENAKVLLDIGCGTGITSLLIKEQFPKITTLGIEVQTEARRIAAKRLDRVTSHDLQGGPLPTSFLPAERVDLVIMLDVLEHMTNPWQALLNLRHCLATNATVVVSLPNARCLAFLEPIAAGSFAYASCGLFDVTHVRFFTKSDAMALLGDTGFEIEDMVPLAYPESMMPRVVNRTWQYVETENLIVKHEPIDGYNELFAGQWLIKARKAHLHTT